MNEPLVSLSDGDGPSFADEINALHKEVNKHARSALEKAIRIGELLVANRAAVRHGDWLNWLKKNIAVSDQTARNYIRIYEDRDNLKFKIVLNLTDALALLAKKTDRKAAPAKDEKPEAAPSDSEPKPAAKQKPKPVDDEITTAPVETEEAIWRKGLLQRAQQALSLAQYDDWSRFTFDEELGDVCEQAADAWIELTNYLRTQITPPSSDDNVPF